MTKALHSSECTEQNQICKHGRNAWVDDCVACESEDRQVQMDADAILKLWKECGHACNDGNALKFARALLSNVTAEGEQAFQLTGDEVRALARSQEGTGTNAPQISDYIIATALYLRKRAMLAAAEASNAEKD